MGFEKVLGQVLRDIRIHSGLTRTELVETLHVSNLSKIENGQILPRIDTLAAICGLLGVALSDVLLVVEARRSGLDVEDQIRRSNKRLMALLDAGRLNPVAADDAIRGIRGHKADSTRDAVLRLQGEGLSKEEIARKLGAGLRTVQRYWKKDE
ncbi:TPA: helix-turn-helix transcriptional regulator [Pseudomonas aeruginosa]|jgi:transcriptional regulator with XRE-family HTH domain|nr:helix-turn-helix transcriptional regulator [Pseudomonas aeruginosa]